MNNVQKQLVSLLKEINDICEQHNISYVLCGRTSKDACINAGFLGEYVYASVLMHAKDFLKFRKIVSHMENRATESILDNPAFPDGRTMRYINENTTFMYSQNAHLYNRHGIYISIQQARSIPSNRLITKVYSIFDKLITAISLTAAPHTEALSHKKRMALNAIDMGSKLLGKARTIRLLVRLQNLFMRRYGKELVYIRKNRPDIVLKSTMLTTTKATIFEGLTLRTPVEEDAFIKLVCGHNWAANIKEEGISSPHTLIFSDEIGYKDFAPDDVLAENRSDIQRMINERNALSQKISALRKNIEKNWDILFMTRERYRLFTLYKPVEAQLTSKLAEGDLAYLNKVMFDYLENVKLYIDKNWPLQVSPGLDSLVLELLKRNGEVPYAKRFNRLLATVTLKPISLELTKQHLHQAQENLEMLSAQAEENQLPLS